MPLKLRVISDHHRVLGHRRSHVFGAAGGSIGRAPDNEWVLPDRDRYISSHHCQISFRDGCFLLEDTSTNGVFVNDSETPVCLEGTYTLRDGDRLRMGDYEILVSVQEDQDAATDQSVVNQVRRTPEPPPPTRHREEDLGEILDLGALLRVDTGNAVPQVNAYGIDVSAGPPPLVDPAATSSVRVDQRKLPQPEPPPLAPGVLPSDDWRMATRRIDRRASEAPNRPKMTTEFSARDVSGTGTQLDPGVEAFCRGAGIDPGALTVEAKAAMLSQAGRMLREATLGVMEALQARASLRSRLHLSQTMVQPTDTNPLKSSTTVDEALRRMLDAHSSQYLGPADSIREAFVELRSQQTAYNCAVQTALRALLSQLDPGELQARFEGSSKRASLLGATSPVRYWEKYEELYRVLTQPGADGLPAVFSQEFIRAYEAKLADVRGTRNDA